MPFAIPFASTSPAEALSWQAEAETYVPAEPGDYP